jgi:hypothetical protein
MGSQNRPPPPRKRQPPPPEDHLVTYKRRRSKETQVTNQPTPCLFFFFFLQISFRFLQDSYSRFLPPLTISHYIYLLCFLFLQPLPLMANGANSKKDAKAQHWISWRDTLHGFLQSPAISQGGGIQTCIRHALQHNPCLLTNGVVVHTEFKGNPAHSQGEEAKVQHPNGAAGGKVVSADAAIQDAAAAASSEANKAMCNNALFDILVSQKFALLCHLLLGTFHVNKPGDVIDLEKIDAKMRNGDYAHNPALFDDDIQQVIVSLLLP